MLERQESLSSKRELPGKAEPKQPEFFPAREGRTTDSEQIDQKSIHHIINSPKEAIGQITEKPDVLDQRLTNYKS